LRLTNTNLSGVADIQTSATIGAIMSRFDIVACFAISFLVQTIDLSQSAVSAEAVKVIAGVTYEVYANGLNGPRGLLFSKNGDLYAVEQNAGTLVQIDQNGRVIPRARGFSEPHDVEIDSEGNFFVADTGNNRIARVTPAGMVETYIGGLSTPVDLAFSSVGELLVCEYGGRRVTAFNSSKKSRVFAFGFTPHGLAFLPDNRTLVNDLSNKRIIIIRTDENITSLATNVDTPIGLAVGPSGDVYAPESKIGKLIRIKPDGTRLVILEGLARPRDPIFDSSGHLYLAETDANRVLKLSGEF
jgi:sugar lactone lactonase YvrE